MRGKIKDLMIEYGKIAVVTYFAIFFLTWGSLYLAANSGVDLSTIPWVSEKFEEGSYIFIAYLATKILQPVRIATTVLLTPIAALAWKRLISLRHLKKEDELTQEHGDLKLGDKKDVEQHDNAG